VPRVLEVDPKSPDPAVIAEAAAVLARGGLVAFPTETVYGLGARGLHAAEVARIFEAKGRPPTHPLILHASDVEMARRIASDWPDVATRLAQAFWPGPLTLVVRRRPEVPDVVSGGLPTVGIRSPRHEVARALIAAAGEPLAAPSANAHTHVSPTTAAHVVRSLGDRVDLVLDGGPSAHGIESTVIDVTCEPPRVLRPGAASLEALRAVIGDVAYEATSVVGDAPRASPGLASKHYAPRARVILTDDVAACRHEPVRGEGEAADARPRTGAITWRTAPEGFAFARRLPADPEGYARGLFAALHDAEAAGCAVIVVERVPDEPAWLAVADRLRRAVVE
jgi:L-threonylcarbamoyladenylate synthase